MMQTWKVPKEEEGARLVSFLKKMINKKVSIRAIKKAIEKNQCLVNQKVERFASLRLHAGDTVAIDAEAIRPPKKFDLEKDRILYSDDVVLFYNKPAWLSSDESGLASLFDTFYVVHRLDKETTGVILFAKTKEAREFFLDAFRQRKVQKEYLALVHGQVKPAKGIAATYLGKFSQKGSLPRFHSTDPKRGKFAKTEWEVLSQGKCAALVKCMPKTGRTHQIRVHLSELGYPIIGDYRYAKQMSSSYHAKRCLLHAHSLRVFHPLTGEAICISAPLPLDFKHAIKLIL